MNNNLSVTKLSYFLLFLCLVYSSPAISLEQVTLQLKWKHQFQFAGYYAAVEKGFYAEEGLEVTIRELDASQNHIQVVLNGDAEYGVSDSSIILHRLKGKPIVVLAPIFQHSPLVLLTKASDDIIGPMGLKGKRVMWQKDKDDAAITALFYQSGIKLNDLSYVPHNYDDNALIKGDVDAMSAYSTYQPFIYKELGMVSKEAEINGIDSREYFYKKNYSYQWVWWIFFFAIAAFLTAVIFWGINRKLKALVDLRIQEIKEQSKYIDQIISATQVGTWKWNIKTGEIILNERWAELIGYTLAELSPTNAKTCMAFIHPDDLIIAEQRLKLHFEGKAGFDFYETDFRMKHKNGHWVWFNARGQVTQWNKNKEPLWMSGTDTDISERKEIEQQISRAHQLIEQSLNEVYLFDKSTLFFVDTNPAARNNMGYTMEELSGLTPCDIKPEITTEEFVEILEPLLNHTKKKLLFTTVHQRKDGSCYPVEVHLQLLEDENPVFIAIIHDITERKNAEQAIIQLNQSLKIKVTEEVEKNKHQQLLLLHQSRLAQMGEMISMIAHQWRQPLNTLAIINQTLVFKYQRGKLNESLMNDFKKDSNKQIQGMSKTIDDFRNFFKEGKEKKDYCINDVISHTINLLNPVLDKFNLYITFDNDNSLYSNGFENELGQALINLINNAKDALIEQDIADKKIEITLEQNEDKIILNITDNAGGIPIAIINRIFEPYFSTKEEKNGTGLGLYMTKLIIEDHLDGEITVSNTQKGANFMIILKASDWSGTLSSG